MARILLPVDGTGLSRSHHGFKLYLFSTATLIFLVIQFLLVPRLDQQPGPASRQLLQHQFDSLNSQLETCNAIRQPPSSYAVPPSPERINSRWAEKSGQKGTVVLRNATLFDGQATIGHAVDITFRKGIISSILPSDAQSQSSDQQREITIIDLGGKFVTPGLVDMHSHHLGTPSPAFSITDDLNEIHSDSGPLTPFVSALDALKSYDQGATIVASGGVTSSLILPGSANVMGGEAVLVKNFLSSGDDHEQVVEELLLEHGIPESMRKRYIKIACGENPAGIYEHTRMGTSYIFRHEMAKADKLRHMQDDWCIAAAAAQETRDIESIKDLLEDGGLPQDLELQFLTGVLRGQVGVNIHCYEPEDMEAMIRHSKEFGFRIQAFHHALEAWRIPEMLKTFDRNLTVATFSHFSHYKHESYDASLYAGKILDEHDVPVAYKSDGSSEELNSKYLLSQAAEAHSFGLPAEKALQSVTSVPARSLGMDHRIGYARPGYDADIIVWDSHPLVNGATPLQVFIDGRSTLETDVPGTSVTSKVTQPPLVGQLPMESVRAKICEDIRNTKRIAISGIQKFFLQVPSEFNVANDYTDLTMVLEHGRVICVGKSEQCATALVDATPVSLNNAYVLPGLTAVVRHIGLSEILLEASEGDGSVKPGPINTSGSDVIYAKNGLRLEGKDFDRARLGGVTKAIVPPMAGMTAEDVFLQGVSTAFKIRGDNETILDAGVLIKEDVALHFVVGEHGKTAATPTISSAIGKLRDLLNTSEGQDTIYGLAANGSLPIVVHVLNHHDILNLIKLKQDLPQIDLILFGASEASIVATELAAADIPLIYTGIRPMPSTWEVKDVLTGPPLTVSPIKVLFDAGVKFGIAQNHWSDSGIHNLAIDAGFARKVAGLTEQQAVDLVSRNIKEILHIDGVSEDQVLENGFIDDFVIFEGNPLEWGARVILTVDGAEGTIAECWPDAS